MTTQRFIITKDSAYAMVDENSSEIDRIFSLAQAQTMRKFMASEEDEWDQVDPKEAIRVEIVLENNNMDTTYYCCDKTLILLAERLFAKEKSSMIAALKLHRLMNMEEVAHGTVR